MGLFGGGNSSSQTVSSTTSTTSTGTGLTAGGIGGAGKTNVSFVQNDPATALAALQTGAYVTERSLGTVDSTVGKAFDSNTRTLSDSLKAVSDTVKSATGILGQTQELYYSKLADNAGVAPQTLQQQQQGASSDIMKLALFGVLALGAVFILTKAK